MTEKEFFRIGEAAEILPVTTQTIRNWIKSGKMKAERTRGGHYRIPASEIKRITRLPLELPASCVCIVCKHQLNHHVYEGEIWRCHDVGNDLCQCECRLDAVDARSDIMYYDFKTRWTNSCIEFFGKEEFENETKPCETCNGGGIIQNDVGDGMFMDIACDACHGIGKISRKKDVNE